MTTEYTAASIPTGFWVLDDHAGSPPGKLNSSVFAQSFGDGFAAAFARYAVLGERLSYIIVDGWPYVGFRPLTDPAEIGRRVELAVSTDLLGLLEERARAYLGSVMVLEAERVELMTTLRGLDDAALADRLVEIAERVSRIVRERFADVPVGALVAEYVWAAADRLGWDEATALAALGSVPAAGSVAHTAAAVARALRERHPELATRVRDGEVSFEEVAGALDGCAEGAALDRDLDHLFELSVAAPSMRERPDLLVDILRNELRRPMPSGDDHDPARSIPEDLEHLAARARLSQNWRDESQNLILRWMGLLRAAALEAAGRLVDRGSLVSGDMVFDLDASELAMLLRGRGDDLVVVATERHAARSAAAASSPPPVFGTPPDGPPGPPPGVALPDEVTRNMRRLEWLTERLGSPAGPPKLVQGVIHGVAASPGCHEGRARVLRRPDDLAGFQAGDVLVCAFTSPAWNPIIAAAGAVVCDSGGVAGHTAITAREFGVPAVVGTKIATRAISDGQVLFVDGSAGTVTPVER